MSLSILDKWDGLTEDQRRDWWRATQEAQRHWLAFREKDCNEVTAWETYGGTIATTAKLYCRAEKTRARASDLKERYGIE